MTKKSRLFKTGLRKANKLAKQFFIDNKDEFDKAFYNLVCYGFICTELKKDGTVRNIDYPEFEQLRLKNKIRND